MEKLTQAVEDACFWIMDAHEDFVWYAQVLEENGYKKEAEELRDIVNRLEELVISIRKK